MWPYQSDFSVCKTKIPLNMAWPNDRNGKPPLSFFICVSKPRLGERQFTRWSVCFLKSLSWRFLMWSQLLYLLRTSWSNLNFCKKATFELYFTLTNKEQMPSSERQYMDIIYGCQKAVCKWQQWAADDVPLSTGISLFKKHFIKCLAKIKEQPDT